MAELIITEKPSSAKKVAEALADGKPVKRAVKKVSYYELTHGKNEIIVTSAVGHLFGLQQKKSNGFTYPVFDIGWEETYKTSNELKYVKDYLDVIKKLAKNANQFTIACDYDIEGEVIGRNIIQYACKKKDANRMKFSTLTKDELVASYEKKSNTLNWGQAEAGETRHKLDWFYGINLSRALTASVKAAGSFKIMSIGRVQGPTLKLLADREKEIQSFVSEPFRQIRAVHEKDKIQFESWHQRLILNGGMKDIIKKLSKGVNKKIQDQLLRVDTIKQAKILVGNEEIIVKENPNTRELLRDLRKSLDIDRFWDKKEAQEIYNRIKNCKKATVTGAHKKQFNQLPPHPFDLTTLQTESYRNFRINPKQTLEIAQTLYVAGLISYPRTSSQQLSPKLGFKKILDALSKQGTYKNLSEKLLQQKKLMPNNGKKTDPAHPALYPTGIIPKRLDPRQQKIYDLVTKRFLAAFAPAAKRETMTVTLDISNERFITKGTRTIEAGWHIFYQPYLNLDEAQLPSLKEKDTVPIKKIEQLDKDTQPPKRFTQSSIIRELEKRNLGTKATRADVLDRLFRRGYVEGVQITTTQFGIETITVLEKHSPTIVDEQLTRNFEEEMDLIRVGKHTQEKVIDKAKGILIKLLEKFKKNEKKIGKELLKAIEISREEENLIGSCPTCKEGSLKKMYSKKNKKYFVACDKYPECETTFPLPSGSLIKHTDKVCETCKHPIIMAIRKGRYPQQVCIKPDCKSKKGSDIIGEGEKCSKCGKGKMVIRRSIYGQFLACDAFPKCRNIKK